MLTYPDVPESGETVVVVDGGGNTVGVGVTVVGLTGGVVVIVGVAGGVVVVGVVVAGGGCDPEDEVEEEEG